MQQVADEVALDLQVAFIDIGHPRQGVHVLNQLALRVMPDAAVAGAVAQAGDLVERAAFGHFLAGEIEFLAPDPINGRRGLQGLGGEDGGVGADKADEGLRAVELDRLGHLAIVLEGGGRGVNDDVVVVAGLPEALLDADVVRRAIEQLALRHQRRRLRQPCGIPETGHLPPRLVARAGPAIEAVEGGGTEKQGPAHCLLGFGLAPRPGLMAALGLGQVPLADRQPLKALTWRPA